MTRRLGQWNPIVRVEKGKLPIPTPGEIVKDKLKELALKYGWDAAKWAWGELSDAFSSNPHLWEQLKKARDDAAKKKKQPQKQLGTGNSGAALLVIGGALMFAGKRKRRRR